LRNRTMRFFFLDLVYFLFLNVILSSLKKFLFINLYLLIHSGFSSARQMILPKLCFRVFFKWAAMGIWAVETAKWALVKWNLGSWKMSLLKNWTKIRCFFITYIWKKIILIWNPDFAYLKANFEILSKMCMFIVYPKIDFITLSFWFVP